METLCLKCDILALYEMELFAFIYVFLSDALLTSLLSEEPSYFKHQKSEKYHDFMVPNGARYAFRLS